MKSRIFIADPAIKDQRGHHFQLTENMSNHCRDQGFNVVWLVNKNYNGSVTERSGVIVYKTFSEDTYDGYRRVSAMKEVGIREGEITSTEDRYALIRQLYRVIPLRYRYWLTPQLHRIFHFIRTGIWIDEGSVHSKLGTNHERVDTSRINLRINIRNDLNSTKPRQSTVVRPEQEIYRSLKACGCKSYDSVLFHTCDAHTYRDVLAFFTSVATIGEWNQFPTFHMSTPYDDLVMPHNGSAPSFDVSIRKLNNFGLIGKRIFLYAENELIAAHLTRITGLKVEPLQIPPPLISSRDEYSSDTWRVCYLGAARTEKGFTYIADAVRSVLQSGSYLDIEFFIQISPQIMGYTPDIKEAISKLKQINDSRLHLMHESMSSSEYEKYLHTADVMLLCYDHLRYARRSSGIAVECAVNQVSMITTADTFPSYLSGEGTLEVRYGDTDGIVNAIKYSYHNRRELRKKARKRKADYLDQHSGQSFVGAICRKGLPVKKQDQVPFEKYHDSTKWKKLIGSQSRETHTENTGTRRPNIAKD